MAEDLNQFGLNTDPAAAVRRRRPHFIVDATSAYTPESLAAEIEDQSALVCAELLRAYPQLDLTQIQQGTHAVTWRVCRSAVLDQLEPIFEAAINPTNHEEIKNLREAAAKSLKALRDMPDRFGPALHRAAAATGATGADTAVDRGLTTSLPLDPVWDPKKTRDRW